MTDAMKGAITLCLVLGIGIVVGMGIGWKCWKPGQRKTETYAPQVNQIDGSVVLERKPMTPVEAAKMLPRPNLPKGAKVERQVQVVIQPSQPVNPLVLPRPSEFAVSVDPQHPPCPPVRVDLALVRMPDETRRVIASSPDGKVVGGVDIPVEAARAQKLLKWAAGGSWNFSDKTCGAWIQRDIGPVVMALDVMQQRIPAPNERLTWATQLRVGLRF